MRLLGIDLGTKTMGLAISDVEQKYISPLKKFDFKNENYSLCVKEIEKIIIQYQNEIEKIILGYPTKMNKEKTEWTYKVIEFKKILQKATHLPVHLQDERMTTIEANTIMKEELNFKGSMMKKKKDIISAIVILEQYLNSCKKK